MREVVGLEALDGDEFARLVLGHRPGCVHLGRDDLGAVADLADDRSARIAEGGLLRGQALGESCGSVRQRVGHVREPALRGRQRLGLVERARRDLGRLRKPNVGRRLEHLGAIARTDQ